jgi:hypothetical protein
LNGGEGNDELTGDGTGIESQKDKFKASPGKDTITDFFFGIDELISSNHYEWDGESIVLDSSKNSATINVLDKASGETVGTTVVTIENFDQFEEIFNNPNKNPDFGFPPSAASDPNTKLIYKSDGKDFEAIGGQEANTITVDQIAEFANYYYEDEDRYFSKGRSVKPNTAGSDNSYSIDGHGGDDTIKGGDNDDYLHGNVGDDKLDGGPGNDRLLGGTDNDTIEGGIGDDKLFGWSGEDSLIGGEGNDYLKAEDGADTLEGGEGEDTLNGGSGQDFLRGGKHADTYVLSFGNDTIKGYQKIDKITLSQEILDAGVDSNDIEIERTIIDEKEAAFLSFELKGIEHTTTVIGVNDAEYDYLQEDFDKTTETPNDELLTKLLTTTLGRSDDARTVVLPATTASYIDWGDGNIIQDPTSDDLTHTYDDQNQYTIQAVFDWDNSTGIGNWGETANKLSWLADVTQFGQKTYGDVSGSLLKSGRGAFAGFAGQSISALSELDTSNLSSTYRMFSGARLFNQDLGEKFLHDGITNAFAMLSDANVFNNGGEASIGQWNTSNVTYMRSMFDGAGLFNQDLSDWDTSAVRDPQNESGKEGGMQDMFKNTPVFAADLSGWNAKNLNPDLNTNFNTSLGSKDQGVWPNFGGDPTPPSIDTPDDELLTKLLTTTLGRSKDARTVVLPATTASYIDWGDGNIIQDPTSDDLTHTYDDQNQYTIQAVFDWDNSTGIGNWGETANKLSWLADVTQFGQKTYGDVSGSLLKSGEGAFAGFAGQSISALSELDTSNLSSTYRMFSGARLFNQDLGEKFLHDGITNAFAMLSDANVFNNGGEASIGQWNTSNVTYMRSMFDGAGLFNQDLSDWDTSAVRDPQNESGKEGGMQDMFKNTPVFAADLSGWNAKNLNPDLNTNFNTSLGSKDQGVWPNFGEEPLTGGGDGGNGGGGNGGDGGDGGNSGGGNSGGGNSGGGNSGGGNSGGGNSGGGNSGGGNSRRWNHRRWT